MLRLLLGLLIVAVSILIGFYLSSRLSRRRTVLTDYISLLDEAANRLSYTSDHLAAVFGENFAGFHFESSLAFAPQWEKMTEQFRDVLTDADRRVLCEFAEKLGEGDIPSQLNRIRLYQSLLKERLDEARECCEKKGALYRVLPFSIGLIITILLL